MRRIQDLGARIGEQGLPERHRAVPERPGRGKDRAHERLRLRKEVHVEVAVVEDLPPEEHAGKERQQERREEQDDESAATLEDLNHDAVKALTERR